MAEFKLTEFSAKQLQDISFPEVNYDTIQDLTVRIASDIEEKKGNIILQRIKDAGFEFDFEKEKTARFKKLAVENKCGSETWYYNDGSENGFRLVTFYTEGIKTEDYTRFSYDVFYK